MIGNGSHEAEVQLVEKCDRCGGADNHRECPVCDGRGCVSPREIAEKLGLSRELDVAALNADGIAKAVNTHFLAVMKEVKASERTIAKKEFEIDREKLAEAERQAKEALREQRIENAALLKTATELEQKLKDSEERMLKRRGHPASTGRVAERGFAAVIGREPDFRVGEKLAKNGDYEVWFSLKKTEIVEPLLIDVKRDSAVLSKESITKLVRDCSLRGRVIGVLVADCTDEVFEAFGPNRLRQVGDTILLLTSIDDFTRDVRLLAAYFAGIVEARRNDDRPRALSLLKRLGEISGILADVENTASSVALSLEKNAERLRSELIDELCARARQIVTDADAAFRNTEAAPASKKRGAR